MAATGGAEITKDGYCKCYQMEHWLATELQTKTVRQIAKERHVSYKLINKWAIVHGLMKYTPEVQLP